MSKKYLLLIFLFLLFFGSLKFSDSFQERVLQLSQYFKIKYLFVIDYLENLIIQHHNQQKTIQKLTKENIELKKYKLEFDAIKDELESLKKECNVNTKFFLDVKLVRSLSYTKLGDFSSLWIDFNDFNPDKIYGLISGDYAAGIVASKNSKPIAFLNSNEKCTYAVEIGESKASGIAIGKKNGIMIVKFIPMHKQIKVGDEVVTSGMDKIFFYGVKVGKVIKIEERGSYKVAVIKTYASLSHPKYFWVVLNSE